MKAILILLALVAIASAEYPAPAGFKWGASPAPGCKKAMSAEIKDNLTLCTVTTAPKPLPWVNEYTLVFVKGKLVKVLLDGKPTSSDITGSENKELYEKIKETLGTKYGEPENSYEITARKLYEEYDEFYECLAYTGCGVYYSSWKDSTDGATMALEIKPLATYSVRGKGYVRVTYESVAFNDYLTKLEEQEDQATTEGL